MYSQGNAFPGESEPMDSGPQAKVTSPVQFVDNRA